MVHNPSKYQEMPSDYCMLSIPTTASVTKHFGMYPVGFVKGFSC